MTKKKILLVDDNPVNLAVCKKTLNAHYEIYPVSSAEKMFDILKRVTPDLILLDVEMPVMNGYEALRVLKGDSVYKEIPVIFLSAMDDAQSEIDGLNLGAADYIHKPFVGSLLVKRVQTNISLIEGKKELQSLINERGGAAVKLGSEIRPPLTFIIKAVEDAVKSEDIAVIKQALDDIDENARAILGIVDAGI